MEVVFAAHDAVVDNALVGDDLLSVHLTLLGVDIRDLRDEPVGETRECRVAPVVLTETTLLEAMVAAVRDPATGSDISSLLTRVAFGLCRAWRWADARRP